MRRVIVRYKVKSERLAEHEGLIARVFAQLKEQAPAGLRYEALKLADGVSFVHTAFVSADDNPLPKLPAFKEFTADIASRCDEKPISSDGELIGGYDGLSKEAR